MICCKSLLKQDIIEEFLVFFIVFTLILIAIGRLGRNYKAWVRVLSRGSS